MKDCDFSYISQLYNERYGSSNIFVPSDNPLIKKRIDKLACLMIE